MDTPTRPDPSAPLAREHPKSRADLFISFSLLALQGFGGVMAVVHRELVEKKRWLTKEEFIEEWAVAQIMPGPNVINLSLMIGARYFGLSGAMAAMAGMIAMPMVLVLLLALLYAHFGTLPGVAGALRGMGAVAAGLIFATAFKLMPAMRSHPLGIPVCIGIGTLCFCAIALLHLPLGYVLAVLGLAACVATYLRIKP